MGRAGSPADPTSSSTWVFSHVCSAGWSWRSSPPLMRSEPYSSSASTPLSPIREPSPPIWPPSATPNVWATATAPSGAPRNSCPTSRPTPRLAVSTSPPRRILHPGQRRPLQVEGCRHRGPRAIQGGAARSLRVRPPLPDACIATGLSSHPLLRSAHHPNPRQEYRSCPRVARSAAHPDRCHQSCQRHVRGAKTPTPSLPLLPSPPHHHPHLLPPTTP